MAQSEKLVEIWRGDILESVHSGSAVVCNDRGDVVHAWGDPNQVIYPRSSCKMIQALPLIECGAAKSFGLKSEHLALACASHNGAKIHTSRVSTWLKELGLTPDDLRCGPQLPNDIPARNALIKSDTSPCQIHNNCSGKHCGFLTLNRHIKGDPEYIDTAHPVQKACLDAFEDLTGIPSPGFGIDGCSAPNHATTVHGLALAAARFGSATDGSVRGSAMVQLREAMMAHPDLVAGEGRACTELMRAMGGRVAIKTGAEAVFVAIIPDLKLGVALKIDDGATRGSECAIASILVKFGVLDPNHPATLRRWNAPILNRRGIEAAFIRPSAVF